MSAGLDRSGLLVGSLSACFLAWLLGTLAMRGILILWQRASVRRDPTPMRTTGPAGHFATAAVFLALYLTPSYAPGLSVTSGAALAFFGGSMLVAAVGGYRGWGHPQTYTPGHTLARPNTSKNHALDTKRLRYLRVVVML